MDLFDFHAFVDLAAVAFAQLFIGGIFINAHFYLWLF